MPRKSVTEHHDSVEAGYPDIEETQHKLRRHCFWGQGTREKRRDKVGEVLLHICKSIKRSGGTITVNGLSMYVEDSRFLSLKFLKIIWQYAKEIN